MVREHCWSLRSLFLAGVVLKHQVK
jgi:hypothetical protein